LTGAQAGIRTDDVHSKASITSVDADRIMKHLKDGRIAIVAGFQGVDPHEDTTTLGRGGSDTTAVALAAALKAEICEILTDVEGVYTTDPRIVPNARKMKETSYREMLELASLGAKVLHPRAVELARDYRVHLCVRSSLNKKPGTIVKGVEELEKQQPVSGVALDEKTAKISLLGVPDKPGIAASIFTSLADAHINVDMIIQNVTRGGYNDITFTVSTDDLDQTVKCVNSLPEDLRTGGVATDDRIAKLSIVGAGMVSRPGVAAKMFEALGKNGINIEMISTSEIKISCIISKDKGREAVKVLHDAFKLEKE
ncbi:MAG: aspartate kinase, partial [bacterium]